MVDTGFCVDPHSHKRVAGTRSWFAESGSGVARISFYIRLAGTRIYAWTEGIVCRPFQVESFRRDESTDQYESGEAKYEDC